MDKSADLKDLDLTYAGRGVWLVKVVLLLLSLKVVDARTTEFDVLLRILSTLFENYIGTSGVYWAP